MRTRHVSLPKTFAKNTHAPCSSVGYGLLTQIPPYQSATSAYPYVSLRAFSGRDEHFPSWFSSPNAVYYPLATPQSSLQQPIYLNTGNTWPTNFLSQLNVTNTSTSSGQTIYEFPATVFDNPSSFGQQIYWPSYNWVVFLCFFTWTREKERRGGGGNDQERALNWSPSKGNLNFLISTISWWRLGKEMFVAALFTLLWLERRRWKSW